MGDHFRNKNDAVHTAYRQKNGRNPTSSSSIGVGISRNIVPRVGGVHGSSEFALRQQLEYYLSDQALVKVCQFSGQTIVKDYLVLREMSRAPGQWVRLSFLASFPKLMALLPSADVSVLASAVASSATLELNASRSEIRRKQALPGMIGALAKGELVLLHKDEWVHAVWKDEEGFLKTESEKTQQAQQLGCIDPKAVDAWFSSGGALAGTIDMCTYGSMEECRLRERALEGGLLPGTACRWGAACPRLSTDPEHGGHTAAQARLAKQKGATSAVRALGGQWMTEAIRQARLEEQASRVDACPCWKGGAGFCVLPSAHCRDYWQGEATVARLESLEPGVDQNPATFMAKREAKRRQEQEKKDRAAYLQSMTLQRFGGPPPSFAPCWPVDAFESLPDEVLSKICVAAEEWGVLPGDMQRDVRRMAFVSTSILSRLRRVRPGIRIRSYSGSRALQIDRGCWTVTELSLEHRPVQQGEPRRARMMSFAQLHEEKQNPLPRTLELLAQCRALRTIDVSYERSLSSVEAFAACPELRKLRMHQLDGVQDVSPLARCPKLESLTLSIGSHVACKLKVSTVLPLLTSPTLTRLVLDCRELVSMELPAPSAPNLEFLSVGPLRGLQGDWAICRELHTLILAGTSVVKVAPLAGCPKLRILDLGGCPPLHDALMLTKCPSLRQVNIGTATNKKSSFQWGPTISNDEISALSQQCARLRVYTEDLPGWESWTPDAES